MANMDLVKALLMAKQAQGATSEGYDPANPTNIATGNRSMQEIKPLAPGVPAGQKAYPSAMGSLGMGSAGAYDKGFNNPGGWDWLNALRGMLGNTGK